MLRCFKFIAFAERGKVVEKFGGFAIYFEFAFGRIRTHEQLPLRCSNLPSMGLTSVLAQCCCPLVRTASFLSTELGGLQQHRKNCLVEVSRIFRGIIM